MLRVDVHQVGATAGKPDSSALTWQLYKQLTDDVSSEDEDLELEE